MTGPHDPLFRLIYCSRNVIPGDADALMHEIERILATARARNAAAGVTGALVFNDRFFGQVLEGPLAPVEATFERIQRDPRHRDVVVLDIAPIAERGFPHWSMGFVGASENAGRAFDQIERRSGFDHTRLDGDQFYQTLSKLALEAEPARD